MNANQQTLNLTTMKTRTLRKKTTTNWLNFLYELSTIANGKNEFTLSQITSKHSVSNFWNSFLRSRGIVYKNQLGCWQWSENAPDLSTLVVMFRKLQSESNAKVQARRKAESITGSVVKVKTPKIKVEASKVIQVAPKMVRENFRNTETKQIGLIRKFIKWIY